ncbi:MAP2 [Ecytonucleospora hepatopenaei]|uniref:MAP2 n=1 Tax=Ecytonucleospora hepatopenaei TaxID=646526 RepID=A0A1W0E5M9_9MICR|nr:MAP2 [Ecytonucleospora hepatopenaei]
MLLINETEMLEICFLEPENFQKTPDSVLNDALRAAEAHKRIRYNIQKMIRPGCSLKEIIQYVEDSTRIMLKGEKNNGIGFPCGISINNVAAHFSLNPWNDDIILKENDVLKVDFGTHSNGRIIDCAFTACFDEKKKILIQAAKEATEVGIKAAGIDAAVCEIGREINEVYKSYETENYKGDLVPIKPVWNLNGHSIAQYKIHAGISIPPINNGDYSRIKEGFIALETFGSTGIGEIKESGECSHFMLAKENTNKIYNKKNQDVLDLIKKEFVTLPFSHKHIDFYIKDSKTSVQLLTARKFLDPYPPLIDVDNSFVAQFEHTIYLTEKGKTVVSRGEDF